MIVFDLEELLADRDLFAALEEDLFDEAVDARLQRHLFDRLDTTDEGEFLPDRLQLSRRDHHGRRPIGAPLSTPGATALRIRALAVCALGLFALVVGTYQEGQPAGKTDLSDQRKVDARRSRVLSRSVRPVLGRHRHGIEKTDGEDRKATQPRKTNPDRLSGAPPRLSDFSLHRPSSVSESGIRKHPNRSPVRLSPSKRANRKAEG